MQVSLTTTGSLERRLEVAVPAQQVASEVESRLKRISRTARLKGFRPGKAPFTVVRKQYGEQVHAEVVSDLMRSSFAEAMNSRQLKPAGGPRIEPIDLTPGADLKYAAVFEVLPEVKLAPLSGIRVERAAAAVTEADVEAMLESMRRQRPLFAEVQRAAQATDRVTVDFDGTVDGQPFEGGEGRDVAFVVGAGQVLAEFEAAVVGAAAGDTRTAVVRYPAGHGAAALAGRSADFTLVVKKVEAQSLPQVDEEFCKAFGVDSGGLEALRAEVRASMERELAAVIRARVRTQVLEQLFAANPLDVPRSMLEESVQQMQLDMARRMGVRDASKLPAREPFEQPARQRAALGMIMSEIVRSQGLAVDRARVNSRLDDLVATYPNPEEARRAYLGNPDAMRQVESAVLEDQAIDYILAQAQVTERPATFKELTGFGQQEPAPDAGGTSNGSPAT